MPEFCRHNRFAHRCPICAREAGDPAPAPISTPARRRADSGHGVPARRSAAARRGASGVRVRRVAVGPDDGYASALLPGLRSSHDAGRLADELAFAAGRLAVLAADPPGAYAEAAAAEREEGLWLAFAIAYLGPLEGEDPWAGVRAAVGSWSEGARLTAEDPPTGPRGSHDPSRGEATVAAYRAWAARSGSQAAALAGEPAWTPERRFARAYERLSLPGLRRDARFDFLVTAGRLGLADLRADALHVGGGDDVTLGAKRMFGIADTHLLERRAAALAEAVEVPLDALDLGLFNWQQGERTHAGVEDAALDPAARSRIAAALGLAA